MQMEGEAPNEEQNSRILQLEKFQDGVRLLLDSASEQQKDNSGSGGGTAGAAGEGMQENAPAQGLCFDEARMKDCKELLWEAICSFQGSVFQTSKKLNYIYTVKGNEIFVNRKESSKSIIRSSVDIAFETAVELLAQGQTGYGPKKLKVFGASYIWGIFVRFGLN